MYIIFTVETTNNLSSNLLIADMPNLHPDCYCIIRGMWVGILLLNCYYYIRLLSLYSNLVLGGRITVI
jgi:hypothetical protein